jgi:TctA family transporter
MDLVMDVITGLELGFNTVMGLENLMWCLLAVALGTLIGVIPGIGPLTALSLLIPLTIGLDPMTSMLIMAGIVYGSQYGSSIPSILMNVPGTVTSAMTCVDGYQMTQQGRSGVALLLTALSSFAGGIVGIVLLMLLAPQLSQWALQFGPAEYFSLMLMGLTLACVMSSHDLTKNLQMVLLGCIIGSIGTDVNSGTERLNFGIMSLYDGVSLAIMAMGLFGVSSMMSRITSDSEMINPRHHRWIPDNQEWRAWVPSTVRGIAVGSLFGALPGTGPAVASFVSYAWEKTIHGAIVGRGAVQGIAAPEAANNAASQTAFIPTLALGIPGDGMMALILVVLMSQGVSTGPMFIEQQPVLFWTLVMSFVVGNIMLLILNIPLIKLWVSVLMIPKTWLYPMVLTLIVISSYSLRDSWVDVILVTVFGIMGSILQQRGYNLVPVLIGALLSPMMETHFRRAMTISQGSWDIFFDRPVSSVVLFLVLVFLVAKIIVSRRQVDNK